jgi:hypothetical protein
MPDDLKQSQLRTIQYFYVDGSFEFGFGLLCLILAVFFYAETSMHGWLAALVDSSLVLILIGGAWLIRHLITLLKEKVTWPRTGYVTYNRQNGTKRGWRIALGLGVGILVAVVATVLSKTPGIHLNTMPMLSGFLLGVVFAFLGWRTTILRFYLLALFSCMLGGVLAYGSAVDNVPLAGYYLVFGLVLITAGAFVLRAYLRQNPLQRSEVTK